MITKALRTETESVCAEMIAGLARGACAWTATGLGATTDRAQEPMRCDAAKWALGAAVAAVVGKRTQVSTRRPNAKPPRTPRACSMRPISASSPVATLWSFRAVLVSQCPVIGQLCVHVSSDFDIDLTQSAPPAPGAPAADRFTRIDSLGSIHSDRFTRAGRPGSRVGQRPVIDGLNSSGTRPGGGMADALA
jgi:hypothetical protein